MSTADSDHYSAEDYGWDFDLEDFDNRITGSGAQALPWYDRCELDETSGMFVVAMYPDGQFTPGVEPLTRTITCQEWIDTCRAILGGTDLDPLFGRPSVIRHDLTFDDLDDGTTDAILQYFVLGAEIFG